MIVIQLQMDPELGELFAEAITSVAERLDGSFPRPVQEPEDDELAEFWSEDLRRQLAADMEELRSFCLRESFGDGPMEMEEPAAEALCRAVSAVRLGLRSSELASITDELLEAGMGPSPEMSESLQRAYFCYLFLGGLQEAIVQALDSSDNDRSAEYPLSD